MKNLIIQFWSLALIGGLFSTCTMEIYPLSPPGMIAQNPQIPQTCNVPPITENIIGTWNFESTLSSDTITKGTITFTKDKKIDDPNSLFENTILGDPVIMKSYDPIASTPDPSYPGSVFNVYVKTRRGTQTNYFIVINNECNKIHMRLWQSGNNGVGYFLSRK